MYSRQQTAARARLIVRYVAKRLGAELVPTQYMFPDVRLGPTFGLCPCTDDGRITWRAVYLGVGDRHTNSDIQVTTSVTRSVEDTARDLQRRIVPAAKAWAVKEYQKAAARKELRSIKQARIDELSAILGKPERIEADYRVSWDKLRIDDYCLSGESYRGFVASIEVRSWHCFVMIARLVAEDRRAAQLAAKNAGDNAE